MTPEQLLIVMSMMRDHVTYFLLEGPTKQYTVKNLIMGYDTAYNSKINTGDLLRGNLYVDTTVTPVLSWWKGPVSGHSFTLFTGSGTPSTVGSLYQMDGSNTIWLRNNLYLSNGTFLPVQWLNEANGPQYFAIPNLEAYSNLHFRFPYQNTQQMRMTTVSNGLEFSSLTWYAAYY